MVSRHNYVVSGYCRMCRNPLSPERLELLDKIYDDNPPTEAKKHPVLINCLCESCQFKFELEGV